ncbi:MAG: pentapeptide repeat-containing protein [Bacteroidota bacterium]
MLSTRIIGNKIAEARKKLNITQLQLAQRMFISAQAVGKWERGESMPDITAFNRLAEILGVDLNYFSESFRSGSSESAAEGEALAEQPAALKTGDPGNKLKRDMSLGNWADADFSGLKNLNEQFSNSNLQRCLFIGSDLGGLVMKSNHVESCDFSGSGFSRSLLQLSNFAGSSFKDCNLQETEFTKCHVQGCNLSGGNFTNSAFQTSNFDSCDFSGADMSKSNILGSGISKSAFISCSLKETKLSKSYIEGCDFSSADFTGAEFKSGAFVYNSIPGAVWNQSTFIGMQLEDIVFEGSLQDCHFENCVFKNVTFRNSGLLNTFFKNNSFKRSTFINSVADRITFEFLKSGNADVSGLSVSA